MQNVDGVKIPKEFNWVDFTDPNFNKAFKMCYHGTDNLFIQSRAGGGKSLLIKIISSMMNNVVVLSTTGTTAVELCSEKIAAKTVHSFLSLPPVPVIRPEDLCNMSHKNKRVLNKAEIIIIDEASMMSNNLFDMMCQKIQILRQDRDIPRLILFGDVMQLPPVLQTNDKIVVDYFNKEYNGKIMFFNSHYFKCLQFKTIYLRKSYRQEEQEFSDRLFEIGFNEHTQETIDYFNQRVISRPEFENKFNQYVFMSPTNAMVDKENNAYIQKLIGKTEIYKASMSKSYPRGKTLNDDEVIIKEGAQVMCLVNNYSPDEEKNYTNGMIGEVTDLNKDEVKIKMSNGKEKVIGKSTLYLYNIEVRNNRIEYIPEHWYKQIDCRIARGITVHKSQGKTLDAAYVAIQNWVPQSLVYVALSRLKSLDGLGLARPLNLSDITVNQEAYEFLTC